MSLLATMTASILVLCGGCAQAGDTETQRSEAAAPSIDEAPTTQPANAEAAEGSEQEVDWTRINGRQLFVRNYLVRVAGENVGAAQMTVREFQGGVLLRTGLEYWMFGNPSRPHKCEYWFQSYCSEFGDRRPLAVWATGAFGDRGLSFRLQGDGGWINTECNLYGDTRPQRKVKPPGGYRLLNELRQHMYDVVRGKASPTFEWKRCDWRSDPVSWVQLSYHYAGRESISTAEGEEINAHRFDVKMEGADSIAETVWVDEEVFPVRRLVPSMSQFEMILTTADPSERISQGLSWPEALRQFGEEKAKQVTYAADIAY